MYRRYYSINDMPQIKDVVPKAIENEKKPENVHKSVEEEIGFLQNGKVIGKFETDDIILIVIAIILLADDCDDKLLLFALGFEFLSGLL